MTKGKSYTILSLFSGCGGLDLGLEGGFEYLGKKYTKNPLKIIWANDINEKAAKTYKLNFPGVDVICGDITKILNIEKEGQSAMQLPKADVVVGGFPCQDFSLAGKRQ